MEISRPATGNCKHVVTQCQNFSARFSRTHETIIRYLVLPQTTVPPWQCDMTVDDVIVVTSKDQPPNMLSSFDEAYVSTMERIGLKTKDPDPSGFKAFRNLTRGEILGFVIDTNTMSWALGEEKRAKIIQTLDECFDKHDLSRPVAVTLKTAQRAYGKLNALSACWNKAKPWLIFISRDLSRYIRANPNINNMAQHGQPVNFKFEDQARRDLHFLRAILVTMGDHWIPLTDPTNAHPATFDVSLYTDASGKVDFRPDQAPPSLGVVIPAHLGEEGRAVSFPLPMEFLLAHDDVTTNYHHTMLLEGLGILTAIVRWPEVFRNKDVLATTDSASLVCLYNSGRPRGTYLGHLIRALYIITEQINCKLCLNWQPRRSTQYDKLADDLTHQQFEEATSDFTIRAVETLPEPVLQTLVQSVNFSEHVFDTLWHNILQYWQLNL